MARFYKTSDPQFVNDNIYKPPVDLMYHVISNADKTIDDTEATRLSLYDKLRADALKIDEPRAQEIINGYTDQIDNLASKLQENPLEYMKEIGNIRQLGRDIDKNWLTGEISAIQSNKLAYDNWIKRHLERVKATKGYITQDDMTYAQNAFLNKFNRQGGTKYNNGRYNSIELEDLNPYVNIYDIGEKVGKGWESDMINKLGAYKSGNYLYTSKDKTELVKFDDVYNGVRNGLLNDKESMSYLEQQVRLGALSPEEAAQRIDETAKLIANKYSYTRQEKGQTSITGDPFAEENLRHRNAMIRQKQQQQYQDSKESNIFIEEGVSKELVDKIMENDFKFDEKKLEIAEKIGFYVREGENPTINEMKQRVQQLMKVSSPAWRQKVGNKYVESIEALEKAREENYRAGWANYADLTNSRYASRAQKALENFAKNPANLLGTQIKWTVSNKDGKPITGTYDELVKKGIAPSVYDKKGFIRKDVIHNYAQPIIPDVNIIDKRTNQPKTLFQLKFRDENGQTKEMITNDLIAQPYED